MREIALDPDVMALKGFQAWDALFKKQLQGSFIYFAGVKEMGFLSEALSPGRQA